MNESTHLIVAIVVFTCMAVGLVFTVVEFKYGQPSKQAEEANLELLKNEDNLRKNMRNKETEVV